MDNRNVEGWGRTIPHEAQQRYEAHTGRGGGGAAEGGSNKTLGEQWQEWSVGQRADWLMARPDIHVPIHLKEKVLRGGMSPEPFMIPEIPATQSTPETPPSTSDSSDVVDIQDQNPTPPAASGESSGSEAGGAQESGTEIGPIPAKADKLNNSNTGSSLRKAPMRRPSPSRYTGMKPIWRPSEDPNPLKATTFEKNEAAGGKPPPPLPEQGSGPTK